MHLFIVFQVYNIIGQKATAFSINGLIPDTLYTVYFGGLKPSGKCTIYKLYLFTIRIHLQMY